MTDSIILLNSPSTLASKSASIWYTSREFGKRPSPVRAKVIYAGNPVGIHRGFLFLRIFTTVALDLDDEIEQVIVPVPIIHAHDEVRSVSAHFRTVAIRHFQAKVVVLDIRTNAGMSFCHAAELAFPIAIENHPVDVASTSIGFPAELSRGVEIDVHGGARGVVRIEHGLYGPFTNKLAVDAGDDLAAGHIGEHFVLELGRIRAALADQIPVEPLFRDALELTEEMKLGFFAWVAPPVQDQMRCQLIQNLRRSNIAGMNEVEVCFFSNDSGVLGLGRTNEVRRQFENGVVIEFRRRRSSGSSTR